MIKEKKLYAQQTLGPSLNKRNFPWYQTPLLTGFQRALFTEVISP
jgi:hypothetical protein